MYAKWLYYFEIHKHEYISSKGKDEYRLTDWTAVLT